MGSSEWKQRPQSDRDRELRLENVQYTENTNNEEKQTPGTGQTEYLGISNNRVDTQQSVDLNRNLRIMNKYKYPFLLLRC